MASKPQQYKRVSDVIDDTLNPWKGLEQARLEDIAGSDWVLQEAVEKRIRTKYTQNADGDGKHAAMFVKIAKPDTGEMFSLLVSQQVLVDKLRELVRGQHLPVLGCFVSPDRDENRNYWSLE